METSAKTAFNVEEVNFYFFKIFRLFYKRHNLYMRTSIRECTICQARNLESELEMKAIKWCLAKITLHKIRSWSKMETPSQVAAVDAAAESKIM